MRIYVSNGFNVWGGVWQKTRYQINEGIWQIETFDLFFFFFVVEKKIFTAVKYAKK